MRVMRLLTDNFYLSDEAGPESVIAECDAIILASVSRECIGFGILAPSKTGENAMKELAYLVVQDNFRGKGIGSSILSACESATRRLGASKLTLLAVDGDCARLYRRHGYGSTAGDNLRYDTEATRLTKNLYS